MKKQNSPKSTPVENSPNKNPYLDARREWNERYGSYINQAKNWRLTALISMLISLVAVGGVVYIGAQNKLVPYVVQVDKLGTAVATSRADVARRPDDRVIQAQLASFIEASRSIYTDAAAQNKQIKVVYSMLRPKGASYNKMNSYYQKNNPFQRAATETVSVELKSVLPMTANTWQIEWVETKTDREGMTIGTANMQAILTIGLNPPKDEATIMMNPMGVYVDDFSWSAKL